MSIDGLRALLRRFERAELVADEVAANVAWLPVMVVLAAAICYAVVSAASTWHIGDMQNTVTDIVQYQVSQSSGGGATLYPTTTIDGRINGPCSSSGWCSEKIIYSHAADGDHYQGWVVIPTTSGSVIEHYVANGVDTNDNAVGAQVTETTPFTVTTPLQFAHVAATALDTDTRNPVAGMIAAYQNTLGASAVDKTVTFLTSVTGNNGVELDRINVPGLQVTTGMALGTLPAKNLQIIATYATPTPLPGATNSGPLTYLWPDLTIAGSDGSAAGPTNFTVSMSLYHEPFFAEAATGSTPACVVPQPQYVPGTSKKYIATTDFGTTGPWVYPNPNPTTPANSPSGPASFAIAPSGANINPGQCDIQVYSVYTPRSGPIYAGMPTPQPVEADVMDWLTLTSTGKTETGAAGSRVLSTGQSLSNAGDTVVVSGSKLEISGAAGAIAGTMANNDVTMDSTCANYVTPTVSGQSLAGTTPNRTWTGTISFKMTTVNQSGSDLACTATVTDTFNEPSITVKFTATNTEGPMTAWPPAEQMALIGALGTASNGGKCQAIAYTDGTFTTKYKNKVAPLTNNNSGSIIAQTDATGCIVNVNGVPLSGAAVGYQSGYTTGDFNELPRTCNTDVSFGSWAPNAAGAAPGGERVAVSPTKTVGSCTFALQGDPTSTTPTDTVIASVVNGTDCTKNVVDVNDSCTTNEPPAAPTTGDCVSGDPPTYAGGTGWTAYAYKGSFSNTINTDYSSPLGTITNDPVNGVITFTRTAAGTVTIYIYQITENHPAPRGPTPVCGVENDSSALSGNTITFN